ncbi:hypothetical protein D9619_011978 [Psilocybe cf. subviscida]|uniref:Uncharacterized protein n=1 Tax=Psilocybe cf. subviscida TaxID=2480587 RepID=A0A8H5EWE8_9AGAR|nr:hypothetical protein D9619_011978 [Psilocybe cf. subviscida]
MKFISVFVALACCTAGLSVSTGQVISDIKAITAGVTQLTNQLNNFPATGGTSAALSIHSNTLALIQTINNAASDTATLTPTPVSVNEGTAILDAIDVFKPIVVKKLDRLVGLESTFAALPSILPLIKADISNLNTARNKFETAVVAKMPSSLISRASAIKATLSNAFAYAIRAYAS